MLDLAADTEGHKTAVRTAQEEGKIVEGKMAARIVHSLDQGPGEQGRGVRRRLEADSRFGREVGMAVRFGWPEDKVQAAVVRMG